MSDHNWPESGEPAMPKRPADAPAPRPESFNTPPPPASGGPVPPPAPGFGGPAFQEPAKKSAVWKWILGVFVLFVLGVGGCSLLLFNAVKGPIDAANEFLAAAEAGDLAEVVNLASTDAKCFGSTAEADLEDFLAQVSISDYNLSSSYVNSLDGQTTGDVSGTIRAGDQTIAFRMVKVSDEWLVCGIEIN